MRPLRSDCLRTRLLAGGLMLTLCSTPALAQAGTITINFSGTVSVAFGDLGAQLSGGETITGTIELDDTVVGAFTPGTVFLRAEMLYTGAIQSTTLVVDGQPLSGAGGDLLIKDSDGMPNGDDSYEATGVVDTGTVSGVDPASFFFNSAYDDPTFALSAATPLFAPPPLDPLSTNQFQLNSATGGSASGQIDSFSVIGAPPSVPVLSPLGLGLALAALTGLGVRRARGRGTDASR